MPLNEPSTKSAPTANNLVGVGVIVERVGQLRDRVQDVVTRAAAAEKDHSTRAARVRAQFEQALEAERSRFASEMDARTASRSTRKATPCAWSGWWCAIVLLRPKAWS